MRGTPPLFINSSFQVQTTARGYGGRLVLWPTRRVGGACPSPTDARKHPLLLLLCVNSSPPLRTIKLWSWRRRARSFARFIMDAGISPPCSLVSVLRSVPSSLPAWWGGWGWGGVVLNNPLTFTCWEGSFMSCPRRTQDGLCPFDSGG